MIAGDVLKFLLNKKPDMQFCHDADTQTRYLKERKMDMYEKIPITGMSNEEWLTLRKTGIGGSDAGSICGVNPFGSPMKVYHDKTSTSVEELDSEAVRQGHDLEDYVAQRFMEATGLKVRRSNFMYRSVENPFMIDDVDRLVAGEDAGLECKTASAYNAEGRKYPAPLHHAVLPLHGCYRKTHMVYRGGHTRPGVYLPETGVG